MSDENTMDNVIDDSQDAMNDFTSFEEADNSVPEGKIEDVDNQEDPDDGIDFSKIKLDDDPEEPVKKEEKEIVKEELKLDKEDDPNKEIKKLVATQGDSKIEVNMDAKVIVPIDGKDVEMTMQEVINKASGIEAVDKRFSELNTEKQDFKVEQHQYQMESTELIGKVDSFVEAVNKNDGLGAITALGNLAGTNPVELRNNFKNLLLQEAKAYIAMTPEQQIAFDNQQQVEYHNQERDELQSQIDSQQTDSDLQNSLLRFQAKNGINDATLVALYDEAEAKSIDIQSAEDLERFHLDKLTQDKSSAILSEIDPSLSSDENALSVVSDFMTKNPEMSNEDVSKTIKDALGVGDKEEDPKKAQGNSLSNKIKSKQAKNQKGKQKDDTKQDFLDDDDDELLSFDELGY